MPHHVRAAAAADLDAVHQGDTGHIGQVERAPIRHRLAQHAAGVEEVVGHQSRRVEPRIVDIARVDDLHAGHHGGHSGRDLVDPVRLCARRQVGAELHHNLAFDPHPHVVAVPQVRRRLVDRGSEHGACARMRDAEKRLHDRRGAANLVACDPTEPGRQLGVKLVLDRIGRCQVGRHQPRRQRVKRLQGETMGREQAGGVQDLGLHRRFHDSKTVAG